MESPAETASPRPLQQASVAAIRCPQLSAHPTVGWNGEVAARIRRMGTEAAASATRRVADASRRIKAFLIS